MFTTLGGNLVGAQSVQDCFTIPIRLGQQDVWALVDTRCGRTLVKQDKGPCTPEIFQMKLIHGGVKD